MVSGVMEIVGEPEEFEGRSLMVRDGATLWSVSARPEVGESALDESGRLRLDPEAPLEASCRVFDDARDARRYLQALQEAAREAVSRMSVSVSVVRDRAQARLEGAPTRTVPRIARWVDCDQVTARHDLIAHSPRSALHIGGAPRWYVPRPDPCDPRTRAPMVCMAQFSGDLDPRLPGGKGTRFYVFGPGQYDGDDARYAVLWQDPKALSDQHTVLVHRDEARFAVVLSDVVQMTPDLRHEPPLPEGLHKAVMVWQGVRGEAGHCQWSGVEGAGVRPMRLEAATSVQGLEDEGFVIQTQDDVRSAGWLADSLAQLQRASVTEPDPALSGTDLRQGYELPLRRVFGGYTLTTTATLNPVEDDLIARRWPGVGGEPEAAEGLFEGRGAFRDVPLVPVLTFDASTSIDHPYVAGGSLALSYVAVPSPADALVYGRLIHQHLDD